MKKRNKKTFLRIKIIFTIIALFLFSGIGVMAVTTKANSVKITLADGYEMTVLTTKKNVAEILKDNNILIKDDEKVSPSKSQEITEDSTIVITNKSKQEVEVAKVSESNVETTLDELMDAYDTIVEKIEVKKEKIPFKTVKKDISEGAKNKRNRVVQEGKKGVKEITYKVKYQNDTEISRKKLSEKIIKKPVDKIVQVRSNLVTSRASDETRNEDYSTPVSSSAKTTPMGIYKVTAYCSCRKCCGGYANGITAVGRTARAGRTIAAPRAFAFGTKLKINGKQYVVEDRGGAIKGKRIDIYMNSHSAALAWGVRYLPVSVIK